MAQQVRAQGPLFPFGKVVWTRGVNDAIADGKIRPLDLLRRHGSGDWGDLDAEDKQTNERALRGGGRLMSSYQTKAGTVWVITEWDRSATTILYPSEY